MHYVLDNNGKKYLIKEINKFYEHLVEFHTDDGEVPVPIADLPVRLPDVPN